jgi:hypothetical protein
MSARFQVLPGLPPYGPLPKQFQRGNGRYREGFVVEFENDNGAWVGNFLGGATGFSTVCNHPDERSLIVIAGGQGYVVDPATQKVSLMFGGALTGIAHAEVDRLVFSTFTGFEAYGRGGLEWQTRRLSWDGFQLLRIDGGILHGEAWTPIGGKWMEFHVDLSTGQATGGAYP